MILRSWLSTNGLPAASQSSSRVLISFPPDRLALGILDLDQSDDPPLRLGISGNLPGPRRRIYCAPLGRGALREVPKRRLRRSRELAPAVALAHPSGRGTGPGCDQRKAIPLP